MSFLKSLVLPVFLFAPLFVNAQTDALLQAKDVKLKAEQKVEFLGSLLTELVRVQNKLKNQSTSDIQVSNAWLGLIISSDEDKINLDQLLQKYATPLKSDQVTTYEFERGWTGKTKRAKAVFRALIEELVATAQGARLNRDKYLNQLLAELTAISLCQKDHTYKNEVCVPVSDVSNDDQSRVRFVVDELTQIRTQNQQMLALISDLEAGTAPHTPNAFLTNTFMFGGFAIMLITALIALVATISGVFPAVFMAIAIWGVGFGSMTYATFRADDMMVKSDSYKKVREVIAQENNKIDLMLNSYQSLVKNDGVVQP